MSKTAESLMNEIRQTYGNGWSCDTCNQTFGGHGWIPSGAKWDTFAGLRRWMMTMQELGVTHVNLRVVDVFGVRHDADFVIA